MYVEMDTSFDDNIRNQVTRGFSDWTTANQNNLSQIRYQMGAVGAPQNNNQINVVWGTLSNNDGSVDTDTVAKILVNARHPDGTIRVATIIFNRGATATGQAGGSPYYDPSLPGYDSVFLKKTRHEVGHGQNINHPTEPQPRGSVMNQSADCANDNCNEQPTAEDGIQPCDNSAVDNAYPLIVPPPPDDGGGGGQPPCAQHWGMNPVYDNEGTVIGYEWMYYGCW